MLLNLIGSEKQMQKILSLLRKFICKVQFFWKHSGAIFCSNQGREKEREGERQNERQKEKIRQKENERGRMRDRMIRWYRKDDKILIGKSMSKNKGDFLCCSCNCSTQFSISEKDMKQWEKWFLPVCIKSTTFHRSVI